MTTGFKIFITFLTLLIVTFTWAVEYCKANPWKWDNDKGLTDFLVFINAVLIVCTLVFSQVALWSEW